MSDEEEQHPKTPLEYMQELGHPMNVDPDALSGFGAKLSDSIGNDNISTAYPPENPTADAA